jgi:hypothetical protein
MKLGFLYFTAFAFAFANLSSGQQPSNTSNPDDVWTIKWSVTDEFSGEQPDWQKWNKAGDEMIVDPGWHNLRNDITGEIGFEFSVSVSKQVTHLGVWDDHDKDVPVRPARSIPTEFNRDQPTLAGDLNRRRLNAGHIVRLVHWTGDSAREIARIAFTEENRGQLSNEFRFLALTDPVPLLEGERYGLLMTTVAGDGDSFHDAASFDGLSPIAHPDVSIIRSLMARGGDLSAMESIPAFEDLHPSFDQERMMVGPSLRFQ